MAIRENGCADSNILGGMQALNNNAAPVQRTLIISTKTIESKDRKLRIRFFNHLKIDSSSSFRKSWAQDKML
jgi:hypothetical protein